MDNSGESDQQLPKSPPRRRRSTFFVRRESIVPDPPPKRTFVDAEPDRQQNEQLLQYCKDLQNEKQQWKDEVRQRRNDYHELREQCKMAKNAAPTRSEMCYSALTDEDIEFLNQKINLSKLCESQQALHKEVEVTRAFYRRAMELDNEILNRCEENVHKIQDNILENSTVDFHENNQSFM
ncbi:unnamed protein product [Leptosia nina]|uniref:Uncharacterized protein n=1 Tax=Leptosia nina TaxID=320188 RepID=A0AAV1JFQ3_9NEOP